MDIDKAREMTINWIGQAPWEQKYAYISAILGQLPEREVKTVQNMTNKTRKDFKRKYWDDRKFENTKRGRVESAPLESAPPGPAKGWWRSYEMKTLVSIDCEHVHLKGIEGRDRIKAGTVSIVNYMGEEIYFAKIYHEPGSFIVNSHTVRVNGFQKNSFQNGKTIEEVMEEVTKFLDGKLVITYGGGTDFESLGLNAGTFDTFDIAEFFKRPKPNKLGQDFGEKIGLRTLCFHFFNEDIQAGVHSPTKDAAATIKLFRNVYVKMNPGLLDRYYKNYELFEDVVKFNG